MDQTGLLTLAPQLGVIGTTCIVALIIIRRAYTDASHRYQQSADEADQRVAEMEGRLDAQEERYQRLLERHISIEQEFAACRTKLIESETARRSLAQRVALLERELHPPEKQ